MPPRREDHAEGTVWGAGGGGGWDSEARPLNPVPADPRRSAPSAQRRRAREIATSSRSPAQGCPPDEACLQPPRHRPAGGGRGPGQHGPGGPAQSGACASSALARAQAPEQRPGGPAAPRRGPRMVRSPRPGQGACLEATATIPARVPPAPGPARCARRARRGRHSPRQRAPAPGHSRRAQGCRAGSRAARGHAQTQPRARAQAPRRPRARA